MNKVFILLFSSGTNRKESTGAFQDILSVDSTSQYDDFHTIDWVRDVQKYRNQRKEILKKRHDSLRNKIYFYLYSGAGWIVISLVGLATGKKLRKTIRKKVEQKLTSLAKRFAFGNIFLSNLCPLSFLEV